MRAIMACRAGLSLAGSLQAVAAPTVTTYANRRARNRAISVADQPHVHTRATVRRQRQAERNAEPRARLSGHSPAQPRKGW